MKFRWGSIALTAVYLVLQPRPAAAADDATLLRVFLRDGTSLVSYGEFARVADRVVFSLPTSSTPNPPLQLVNIAADKVDWLRTTKYAEGARAARYVATQAESDYVVLNNTVSNTLRAVAFTADPAKRLAIVEGARRTLAEWPQGHFNYKVTEVRQLLSMLDETIADLRAAAGGTAFSLSLVAVADAPPSSEPMLPPPSPIESVEGLLTVARMAESPSEREAMLEVALKHLNEDASLPSDWAKTTRLKAQAVLDGERRIDAAYQTMVRRVSALAEERARAADVRGIQRVMTRLLRSDVALGGLRPETVSATIVAIQERLDAARRLRLARDRFALRLPDLQRYRAAMEPSLMIFAGIGRPLDNIKELAGSTQTTLGFVRRESLRAMALMEHVRPPEEMRAAHALLLSAAHLADTAARLRNEATASGDTARAWDASSAAAGALMLGAKARTDIQTLLRGPQLQ